MTAAPALALVHVPPRDEDPSDLARDIRGRIPKVVELGRALGIEAEVIEARDLLAARPGSEPIAGVLRRARAVWWLGRITFLDESVPLFAAIRAHLEAIGRPEVPVLDDPDHVEEAFSLARFDPLLEAAGVPQAATRLVPLSPEEAALPEDALRAAIAARTAEAGIRFDGPLFFRTYYGTLKIASGLNGAFSAE
ncbi:MAG TPA: hypothetical protein VHF22_01865, partial [Planctomycetota bacterium]|nr:hypothetical protein [Planctomycetota bacterium]